ncbi:hypothetical protein SBDP2_240029 [Syntrophobacter sp. SbD2]|nr:hypothetical protein SBDP2_240029 [Syntrophobacter sp. SbD2]
MQNQARTEVIPICVQDKVIWEGLSPPLRPTSGPIGRGGVTPPLDLEASLGGRAVDEVDMVNEVDLRQAHTPTHCGRRRSAT